MGYGSIPRIGVPKVLMTDGPQGGRLDAGTATAFPCGLAMAATWNPCMLNQAGVVMGEECRALNRRIFLAPAVNIMRSPLGGRNFEYMGGHQDQHRVLRRREGCLLEGAGGMKLANILIEDKNVK